MFSLSSRYTESEKRRAGRRSLSARVGTLRWGGRRSLSARVGPLRRGGRRRPSARVGALRRGGRRSLSARVGALRRGARVRTSCSVKPGGAPGSSSGKGTGPARTRRRRSAASAAQAGWQNQSPKGRAVRLQRPSRRRHLQGSGVGGSELPYVSICRPYGPSSPLFRGIPGCDQMRPDGKK